MTSKVVVANNFIKCPHCDHRIRLIQHKSVGAVYARAWTSINVQGLIFLKIWRDSGIGDSYITKRKLHATLLPQIRIAKLSGYINPINFAGRISELVSAGTDHKKALIEKIPSVTSINGDIAKGPFYMLKLARVAKVLKKGGILT